MKNKIGFETVLGGIFGIIALIAVFGEMADAQFTSAAIWGGIKDISGTIVAIMVFIVAVKSIIPKKETKPFEARLIDALSAWQKSNSTMIVKSDDDEKTKSYGFSLRTNINDFYNATPSSKNTGWFIRLPLILRENYSKEGVTVKFHLNKGTFFEGMNFDETQTKDGLEKLNKKFTAYINHKSSGFAKAVQKSYDSIDVVLDAPIVDDNDIAKLVELINNMYQAYLASANINI